MAEWRRGHLALRVLLVTRLLFAYYTPDVLPSRRSRIIAFIFCLVVSAVIPIILTLLTLKSLKLWSVSLLADILIYSFFSLFSKLPIFDYFSRVQKCGSRKAEKTLVKLVIYQFIIAVLCFTLHGLFAINICVNYELYCQETNFKPVILAYVSTVFGESPKLIIIGLLYVDVHALLYDVRSRNHHYSVETFILSYERVYNDFQKYESTTKFLIFTGISISCLNILSQIADHALFYESINSVSMYLIYVSAWGLFTAFLPIFLLELVADAAEEIKVQLLNQRMVATVHSTRRALGSAARHVRERPLRYSLLQAVPLDAKLVLSLVSFCITYTIAALQMFKINSISNSSGLQLT